MSKPWMPLYVADYLADTGHLTTLQHGAYLLLIMHYWRRGGLPNDEIQLAQIARLSERQWKKNAPAILAFFDSNLQHKRIDEELLHAEQISNKRKAAAEAKHSKSSANAHAIADQMVTQSQSQSQEKKEPSLRSGSAARKKGERLAADWQPSETDLAFAQSEGLTGDDLRVEIMKFRNHWTGKTGKDATKLDWAATWRNWVLNAKIFKRGGNGQRSHPHRSGEDAVIAGMARAFGIRDGPDAGPGREEIPPGRVNLDG